MKKAAIIFLIIFVGTLLLPMTILIKTNTSEAELVTLFNEVEQSTTEAIAD